MFEYTVRSSLKVFPEFHLSYPEPLKTGSLIEIKGYRYQVYKKICKVISDPHITETILILDKA